VAVLKGILQRLLLLVKLLLHRVRRGVGRQRRRRGGALSAGHHLADVDPARQLIKEALPQVRQD
jgi:hypothetical protein